MKNVCGNQSKVNWRVLAGAGLVLLGATAFVPGLCAQQAAPGAASGGGGMDPGPMDAGPGGPGDPGGPGGPGDAGGPGGPGGPDDPGGPGGPDDSDGPGGPNDASGPNVSGGMGGPGGIGGPGAPPPSDSGPLALAGVYTLANGATKSLTGRAIVSTKINVSGVLVYGGAHLDLIDPVIKTSGNTSSFDNSSFYGQNAGVLIAQSGTVHVNGGTIATTGTGSNGVFSYGDDAVASITDASITATGTGAHGIMASGGGTLTAHNTNITTTGARAAAIATDRGGGTIRVFGGTIKTSGTTSPAIYSTGAIFVENAKMRATGSEGAVIEGANSITLTNSDLSGAVKRGVMIYQSFSGDAWGAQGVFTMNGGSLNASKGPLLFVTNTTANIKISGAKLSEVSGILLDAAADRWGVSGQNGGIATLSASDATLAGNIVADSISSAAVELTDGSVLTGAVQSASVSLDAKSSWVVTSDSAVTSLADVGSISGNSVGNITGNGHTVTYDSSLSDNDYLGGKTYTLSGGGTLAPR